MRRSRTKKGKSLPLYYSLFQIDPDPDSTDPNHIRWTLTRSGGRTLIEGCGVFEKEDLKLEHEDLLEFESSLKPKIAHGWSADNSENPVFIVRTPDDGGPTDN